MGADIISILFFITAIVLAFIRKINIGIVALALAVPCTMLIGLPGKEIIAGVNGNLFITLVGITLLFSIVNDTGALGLLAHKIVAVAGRRLWLIPILLADDGKCIKSVPWGTILMVLGVGALLHIVAKTGGIALLTQILAGMMSPSTASTFMALSAGLLSFVSSALGVVYPTMMPMSVGIAQQIGGINPVALMSAVAAGGSCSGISPMSTGGAMIIAIMAVELKDRFTKEQQNKVFVQLLVIAGANLLVLMACTFLFFDVIANILCPL